MEKPLRVAIIGCGWAGTRHAQAFQQGGAEICWLVDVDEEQTKTIGRSFPSARWTGDYHDALSDPEVDAVSICLPHNLHASVAIGAAKAGKHILCEKPIAASLDEADRMIEAADRAKVILMIAENVRFTPVYEKIRDLVSDGVIGRPALIQMTRECYLTHSFVQDRPWFLDQHQADGGIMMSGGIHDFETMRMLIGEVESVYALRARQRFVEMEGDDTSIATVRFRDGTVGTLVESFVMKNLITAAGPEVHTLRIDGDLGSIETRDGQSIKVFSEREDYRLGADLIAHEIYVPEIDAFDREIEHFIESVRTGREPRTSGRSQRFPLEIVLAAYESMESGLPVRIRAK